MIEPLPSDEITEEMEQEFVKKLWANLIQQFKEFDPSAPVEVTEGNGKNGILLFFFWRDANKCKILTLGEINVEAILEYAMANFPQRVKVVRIPTSPNGNGKYIS